MFAYSYTALWFLYPFIQNLLFAVCIHVYKQKKQKKKKQKKKTKKKTKNKKKKKNAIYLPSCTLARIYTNSAV